MRRSAEPNLAAIASAKESTDSPWLVLSWPEKGTLLKKSLDMASGEMKVWWRSIARQCNEKKPRIEKNLGTSPAGYPCICLLERRTIKYECLDAE